MPACWCRFLLGPPAISDLAPAASPHPSSAFSLVFTWLLPNSFPLILCLCNIFCPISNPLSQRCPCLAAGLSHALWCVGCIQHRAALASPHSGSCSPHCQHLDNYTQCADLEKLLLKMTEKGLDILRACNCLSRRKNLCSPITSTVAAPLTPRWLISFACPPDWVT